MFSPTSSNRCHTAKYSYLFFTLNKSTIESKQIRMPFIYSSCTSKIYSTCDTFSFSFIWNRYAFSHLIFEIMLSSCTFLNILRFSSRFTLFPTSALQTDSDKYSSCMCIFGLYSTFPDWIDEEINHLERLFFHSAIVCLYHTCVFIVVWHLYVFYGSSWHSFFFTWYSFICTYR